MSLIGWKLRGILSKLLRISMSETDKVREALSGYCSGDGIDIGYGGDPIRDSAIAMDLPEKYARYLKKPQHLHGDATQLHWFKDGVLDYVYSSHVLEDFEDTAGVLREWWRVLKPGGHLVLFLPDEQAYRKFCTARAIKPNVHHIHGNFSLAYVLTCMNTVGAYEIVHRKNLSHDYSFELVLRKV